jgi:hypothetical protein
MPSDEDVSKHLAMQYAAATASKEKPRGILEEPLPQAAAGTADQEPEGPSNPDGEVTPLQRLETINSWAYHFWQLRGGGHSTEDQQRADWQRAERLYDHGIAEEPSSHA